MQLIPADATGAVLIPHLKRFEVQGDQLVAATQPKTSVRVGTLLTFLYSMMGTPTGVDAEGSLAIISPNRAKVPEARENQFFPASFVFAVPYRDLDRIAGNFGLRKGELQLGEIAQSGRRFLRASATHLYIAEQREALQAVLGGPTLHDVLTPQQRAQFTGEIVAHVGTGALEDSWKQNLLDFTRSSQQTSASEASRQQLKSLAEAIDEARFALLAVSIEDGLSLRLAAVLNEQRLSQETREALGQLFAAPGPSSLAGLPSGRLLAAYAARGDGQQNNGLAQGIFAALLTRQLADAERNTLLRSFAGIWGNLRGIRAAAYAQSPAPVQPTSPDSGLGLASLVAIVDVHRPDRVLDYSDDLAHLTRQLESLPGFTFHRNAEQLDGVPVHHFVYEGELTDVPEGVATLLGKDWYRIRMVSHEQQLILLVGSDREQLKTALANLRQSRPGLAEQADVRASSKPLDARRKVELHFASERLRGLIQPLLAGRLPQPSAESLQADDELSALALSLSPAAIQLEWRIPVTSVRAFVRGSGL